MSVSIPAPFRRLLSLTGLVPVLALAQAAPAPDELPSYAVTATRTPAALTTLGSAVDTLSAAELARMQLPLLRGALASVPGAPAFASGAPGGSVSLFLRGTNSNQTLFLVDGLRFNDPNTDYGVSLGGACAGACDSLEVAHGPQSTLYGGEAVGGVVSLRAGRGAGPAASSVAVEAGSFHTVQGTLSTQAGDPQSAYTFTASGGHTDNARANNAFDSANFVLRGDRKVSDTVAVGATWRGFFAKYGDPGDKYTNDPDNQDRESNQLATVFADIVSAPDLTSHVTLGGQDRRFVADYSGPFGPDITVVKNRRAVLDWQSTYTANAQHRVTGGFTAEANHTVSSGFGDIDHHQQLFALFAQDEWTPRPDLFLTAGLRRDRFDTFGSATTGRMTAAWLAAGSHLKLRSSYGTGFRTPSFLDLYGQSAFYVGNPHLAPEHARGWDFGADWYFAGNRGTASATWFRTDLRDLITYDFSVFPGTVINVERARTQGGELALKYALSGQWQVRAAYTYLEADNLTQGARLLRRPRHSGTADLSRDFGRGWSAGTGLAFVADRQDVDARTYATVAQPGYAVVRVYGAWQATPRLAVKARVENLLNRKYEEVNGYPQPGVGAYGGVEWKF
jgi:vitamin B12 transporter